jgi:dynein heavy chain
VQVSDRANQIAEECEKDLSAALPILQEAKSAVDCLDKKMIDELRSFPSPPGNVPSVTNACIILLNLNLKRDWKGAQTMMKSPREFMERLRTFDATSVDPKVRACACV